MLKGGLFLVNILIIAKYPPSTLHAGGLRLFDLSRHLRSIFPEARIDLLSVNEMRDESLTKILPTIFDNIVFQAKDQLIQSFVTSQNTNLLNFYDTIDIQFVQNSHSLSALRAHCRKLLFTPMECATRSLRIATRKFNKSLIKFLPDLVSDAANEMRFCREASEVITVSADDANFLESIGVKNVRSLPTSLSDYIFPKQYSQNSNAENDSDGVIFFAYFGSYTNVNALEWYLENVHGEVALRRPNYLLHIVGAGDLNFMEKYSLRNINLVGEVSDPLEWICKSKVGLALAQSGAGFRGKILQYSAGGIPTVANSLAVGGMGFVDGRDIEIADEPNEFAIRILRLLEDAAERKRISINAQLVLNQHHTWRSKYDLIQSIYQDVIGS